MGATHHHRLPAGRQVHLARHRARADIEGQSFWILGGSLPSRWTFAMVPRDAVFTVSIIFRIHGNC